MKDVIVKEVVITNMATRGYGIISSPIRCITQVWDKEGNLIAENDPLPERFSAEDMVFFARWLYNQNIPLDTVEGRHVWEWKDYKLNHE